MAKSKARRSKTGQKLQAETSIPWQRKLIYSMIVGLGFFGFLELGLRVLDFGRPPVLGHLRFGYETGIPVFDSDGIETEGQVYQDMPLFEADSELFWRPIANTPFTGPLGYRKPEPMLPGSDGDLKILVLGDSCSFLGREPYPSRIGPKIEETSKRPCKVVNASCPGYSSKQGTIKLQQCLAIKPDLVIVYFGWNDHWKSLNGCTDAELVERRDAIQKLQSNLSSFRLYWMFQSLFSREKAPANLSDSPVRVPLEDFQLNLTEIQESCEKIGARVIFVTAPTGFQQSMPEWAPGFFGQYYHMTPQQVARIPQTHAEYNQAIRDLFQGKPNCSVVDLEANMKNETGLYRSDQIHLSEAGHQRAAELISAEVTRAIGQPKQ
ncbi:MAG: GDSL-type esterase/lipase family protein [Pirellulales bacterium]